MQQANIAYINIQTKPYKQNDLMLNSLSWYTYANGSQFLPTGQDAFAVYKYNASIAACG
jgi:hypothetical protein